MSETRADAMIAELVQQREQMGNRAAVLAAELAECRKENESLKAEAAKKNGKPVETEA